MYNLLPLIFIVLALAVSIVIIVRKFPAIASLDVDTIPEEKEARFKEQIVGTRIKRNFVKWTSKATKFLKWSNHKILDGANKLYNKLVDVKESYNEEESASGEEQQVKIDELFRELEELDHKEDFEKCESKLIEIIGLDSKNVRAFEMLGDIYYENKQYAEAKRTYEHVLRMLKSGDRELKAGINFDLAHVSKEKENLDEALKYVREALRYAPNNPRFLDTMLEISIMKKDKILAKSTYERLAEVNPENQKLEEWKKKMEEIE